MGLRLFYYAKNLNLEVSHVYGHEAERFSYYRIPKLLFTDGRYKNLSDGAKILYGLMLDRMSLSIKNGYFTIDVSSVPLDSMP